MVVALLFAPRVTHKFLSEYMVGKHAIHFLEIFSSRANVYLKFYQASIIVNTCFLSIIGDIPYKFRTINNKIFHIPSVPPEITNLYVESRTKENCENLTVYWSQWNLVEKYFQGCCPSSYNVKRYPFDHLWLNTTNIITLMDSTQDF